MTQNPQSDFHTDATPFWRANLPAVYAATKDHRIYQHWHGTTPPTRPSVHRRLRHLILLRHPAGPHDTLAELGGELGAVGSHEAGELVEGGGQRALELVRFEVLAAANQSFSWGAAETHKRCRRCTDGRRPRGWTAAPTVHKKQPLRRSVA